MDRDPEHLYDEHEVIARRAYEFPRPLVTAVPLEHFSRLAGTFPFTKWTPRQDLSLGFSACHWQQIEAG